MSSGPDPEGARRAGSLGMGVARSASIRAANEFRYPARGALTYYSRRLRALTRCETRVGPRRGLAHSRDRFHTEVTVTSKLAAVPSIVIGLLVFVDPAHASTSGARVRYAWTVDAPVVATGAALLVTGNAIHTDTAVVPPQGLDVDDIHLAIDRHAVHDVDEQADSRS